MTTPNRPPLWEVLEQTTGTVPHVSLPHNALPLPAGDAK